MDSEDQTTKKKPTCKDCDHGWIGELKTASERFDLLLSDEN